MAKSKTNYFERLRDPRWQKKRLEVLERDGFACQACHDEKTTLNVHHRYYVGGRDPWDYPGFCYVTLCEPCHEQSADTDDWSLLEEGLQMLHGPMHPIPLPRQLEELAFATSEFHRTGLIDLHKPKVWKQEWTDICVIFAALNAIRFDAGFPCLAHRIKTAIAEFLQEPRRG